MDYTNFNDVIGFLGKVNKLVYGVDTSELKPAFVVDDGHDCKMGPEHGCSHPSHENQPEPDLDEQGNPVGSGWEGNHPIK